MPKGPQLIELIKGSDRVFLIEQPKSNKAIVKLNKEINLAADELGVSLHSLPPEDFNIDSLVSIFASDRQTSAENSEVVVSRYRLIRQGLSDLNEGVVLINDAHKMNGESVQLLSQLIRHVRQENLNWRFILTSATNDPVHKFIRLTSVGVDCYYPSDINPKNAVIEERSVSYIESFSVSNEEASAAQSGNLWMPLAAIAGLCLCAAAVLFYFPISSDTSVDTSNEMVFTPQARDVAERDESIATTDDLNNYLAELQEKERSFEDNLRRVKASNAAGSEGENNSSVNEPSNVDALASSISDNSAIIAESQTATQTSPNLLPKQGPQKRIRPSQRVLSSDVIETIRRGDVEKAKAMAAAGETFIGRGSSGESTMVLSALAEQPAMVAWFLERGVATEFVDDYGHTALYYSAIQGDLPSVKLLVDAGANLNVRSDLDKTPLMASVHNGHAQVTAYLLDKGANLDTQDHSGWSAIFYAVWSNRSDLAALLTSAGARSDLLDNDGYSLQKIAEIRPK